MSVFELIFILVTIFWLAEFFIFRNDRSDGGDQERRSFPLIFIIVVLTVGSSLGLREGAVGITTARWVWWTGLILYASGTALRYWGILHLKEQFTRNVAVRKGDRLVSSGPYRLLRHPLYTGLFFIVVGFCLGTGNVYPAVLFGILITIALLHRIRLEEAMLTKEHGEMYREWCGKRYRFIPFVY
ncbi:isoprenylcysteine carboxylmethyltransferase family protein [Halobacillus kuroshimensis]|uniref:Isoprenylcysteine carboxylmethyltransferase family protein n=1 Tax=Halobacillus kuroshimensis TaxID=302481 RepID=A0ABS3E092_9BACI|nr:MULTISPECIES: isoprenylcysteine carboxylmethyltransferase family protein [Halobacillus]MBN8237026.1 isoprenylcysteine carboxylmethyltransferase family protein [Halobacillus kuroshimensis]